MEPWGGRFQCLKKFKQKKVFTFFLDVKIFGDFNFFSISPERRCSLHEKTDTNFTLLDQKSSEFVNT